MATAAEMLIEEEPGCEAGMLAVMKPPAKPEDRTWNGQL
jgi:hypothetical protein